MKKNSKSLTVFFVLLVLIFFLFFTFQFFSFWMQNPLPFEEETRIQIKPGMSGRAIGRLLKENNVIDSVEVFRWILWIQGVERELRLGTVVLEPPMTRYQLVERLSQKNPDLVRVQIKEGWPSWQIFEELADRLDHDKYSFEKFYKDQEFIASAGLSGETLEGYLYPETYYISLDASPGEVLTQLTNRFKLVARQLNLKDQAAELGFSLHEAVTLASIIEREVRVPVEYRRVSAVFHNRLQQGMKLEADPTVLFAMGDFERTITYSNLNMVSPYNTYQIWGLPPGPICNPGKASQAAAVNPADTNEFYFVSRGDGTHVFSKNYEEHQKAVNKYQR